MYIRLAYIFQHKEDVDFNDSWDPKLSIDNTAGEPKETVVWKSVQFNSRNEAFICERRKLSGVFLETMELQHYPFDTQVFSRQSARCVHVLDLQTRHM